MQRNSDQLPEMLKALGLAEFVQRYQVLANNVASGKDTAIDFLHKLAQFETDKRYQKRIERLIKNAKLPRDKLLQDFEIPRIKGLAPTLVANLSEGGFMDRCENILIFGNPGTGKTHLSIGLAREWCLQGRKVLYTTAAALVQELLVAKQGLALNAFIKKLDRFEALIIDDISYIPYDARESDVLFVLLSARYEQRSLIITSNLAFSSWQQIFKDEMTAAAAIDRLVHHATILELNAESYRVTTAKQRKKKTKQKEGNMDN